MKFLKSEGKKIKNSTVVKVTKMNHVVEVMSVSSAINGFENLLRLSKTQYTNLTTGEVFEYNLSENRAQNMGGLKKSFKKIRNLINNNFTGGGDELHLTLTYAENMTDNKQLYSDFDMFWKRFKYKYGKDFEYLSVIEPQGDGKKYHNEWHAGTLHSHLLIKNTSGKKLYLPNSEIRELWSQGWVTIKALKEVDNIGAYLSAYLADIEATNENILSCFEHTNNVNFEIKEVEIDGKSKKFIKGGRLHLYPPGMNLYRHSKGIIFPESESMTYIEAKKIVGDATPNYSRTVTIADNDGRVLNEIIYEQYNTKHKIDNREKKR